MNELRQNVLTAESNLRAIASQQITEKQEDAPEYKATMQNINIVKQVQDLLKAHDDNTETTENKNIKTIENKPLTMNSDLRNKKISSMTIEDKTYPVKSLKDIAIGIGTHLVNNDYQALQTNENKFVSTVTGKSFASTKKANVACDSPVEVKSGRKSLYLDTTRMLANNMTLLKKMTTTAGMNLENIYFN